MHPRAAAQRIEVLIGILGFFAAAALIVTVVAEFRGQSALRPALVLLGFVVALGGAFWWRRRYQV